MTQEGTGGGKVKIYIGLETKEFENIIWRNKNLASEIWYFVPGPLMSP